MRLAHVFKPGRVKSSIPLVTRTEDGGRLCDAIGRTRSEDTHPPAIWPRARGRGVGK